MKIVWRKSWQVR